MYYNNESTSQAFALSSPLRLALDRDNWNSVIGLGQSIVEEPANSARNSANRTSQLKGAKFDTTMFDNASQTLDLLKTFTEIRRQADK